MLQELAARTGAVAWVIGSMLFFLAVWVAIVVWVIRKRPEEMEARARMPLEEGREGFGIRDSGSRRQELDIGEDDGRVRDDRDAPNPES